MNQDEIGNRIDRKFEREERRIESVYSDAMTNAMKKTSAFFKAVQKLDEEGPPAWCETEDQKRNWKAKQMRKLEKEYDPVSKIADAIAGAGRESVGMIKAYGEDVYNTAYGMTQRQLRG